MFVTKSSCSLTAKHILKTDTLSTFFKYKNSTIFLHYLPEYNKQLLNMWYSVYNTEPISCKDIMNESIWNNVSIKIDHKPIQNRQWELKGIREIRDLLNINMDFMTKIQIETNYNVKCNFLYLNRLKAAIPKKWLEIIKSTELFLFQSITAENQEITNIKVRINNKSISLNNVKCNDLYWSEIINKGQRPTSYFKWESEYYYATFDWTQINMIPYKCARETSLQSLQYQIIHRFYPCRYY